MTSARRSLLLLGLASAAFAVACGPEPVGEGMPLNEQRAALAGAPPFLAALHAEANTLLDGGEDGFRRRLRTLRGRPVVVNVWGSWCLPCREELPYFQRQAVKRGLEVAFVGVNANADPVEAAKELMADVPVSYPSYRDPSNEIALDVIGTLVFPATAFYDSDGERTYVHLGKYRSERDLADDIRRYALGGDSQQESDLRPSPMT